MSREEFKVGTHTVVIGVDHVTSAFIQIWASEDQDCANLVIDNMGVRTWNLPVQLESKVREIENRFALSRQMGNPYPNLYPQLLVEIVACLDQNRAKEISSEIYRILD